MKLSKKRPKKTIKEYDINKRQNVYEIFNKFVFFIKYLNVCGSFLVSETFLKRLSFSAGSDTWFVVDGQEIGVILVW